MGYVQIDDFKCPNCNKTTMAELSMITGIYECCSCGEKY